MTPVPIQFQKHFPFLLRRDEDPVTYRAVSIPYFSPIHKDIVVCLREAMGVKVIFVSLDNLHSGEWTSDQTLPPIFSQINIKW